MAEILSPEIVDRRRWMSILAHTDEDGLVGAWHALAARPDYALVRKPEVGTVMVRARADGSGAPYSLAEITVTRCAAQIAGGFCGIGYVAGRSPRRAELAAVLDGMLQDEDWRRRHGAEILTPLARRIDERRQAVRRRAGASRVDFLTLVRERDGP